MFNGYDEDLVNLLGDFMRNQSGISVREQDVNRRIMKHQFAAKWYHYTSIASLVGILSNRELWLGNTATMNDKLEIVDFLEKLQKAVSEDIDPKKIDECNVFFDKLYSRLDNEYPFAFSLSTLSDNAAQWERYADDARGVCIVFDTSRLLNLFWYSGAFVYKVFYQYDIKQHEHYKILKDYFNTGELKELNNDASEMDNLLGCAYMHKHESFCTESEIRLSTLWKLKIAESEYSFEVINGKVKKVLKVSLDKLCEEEGIDFEDLIDGIVIAPRSEQNVLELKEYVESLGYQKLGCKVSVSQCPLR